MVSPFHGDHRRCQAEIPLIVLFRFPEPALCFPIRECCSVASAPLWGCGSGRERHGLHQVEGEGEMTVPPPRSLPASHRVGCSAPHSKPTFDRTVPSGSEHKSSQITGRHCKNFIFVEVVGSGIVPSWYGLNDIQEFSWAGFACRRPLGGVPIRSGWKALGAGRPYPSRLEIAFEWPVSSKCDFYSASF
jgi:hypothetical protein